MASSSFSRFTGGRRLPEEPVIIVPGHHFFTDLVVVAPGTAGRDISALAALALEGTSPFSEAQLAHGYYAAPDGGGALVFATLRRKFGSEQEAWRAASFVVPDFATWLPCGRATPGIVVLETAAGISALEYTAESPLPVRLVSRPVPPESAGEDGRAVVREQVLARLGAGGRKVVRYRLGETPCWQERTRFVFLWQAVESDPADRDGTAEFSTEQLWAMDLREAEFLRTKRRDFQWNRRAWNAFLGLGATAALLLLGEIGLLAGNFWLNRWQARIDAQAPAVAQAQTDAEIVDRLDAYGLKKPQPLEMLAYLHERRPASIYFTRVDIQSATKVVLDASTRNAGDVDEFSAALKAASALAGAPAIQGLRAGDGVTTFQMVVNFRPGFTAPAPPEAPAVAATRQPVAPKTVPVQP